MARLNPHRPFIPDKEQMRHAPDVSGNKINGLGEKKFRRPEHVYWAPNPDDIPHGQMQKWFYTVDPQDPGFAIERKKRQKFLDAKLPPPAKSPVQLTEKQWGQKLDGFRHDGLFDMYGATRFNPDWAYGGVKVEFEHVIVFGFQHDYKGISRAPAPKAGVEVMRQYTRAAAAAKTIAIWFAENGWEAEPVTGPMAGKITLIPPAIEAGFGELGKHGSLINPEFGSSFRLSAVLTNAPVGHSKLRTHHVDDFCTNCKICEDACPPEAISPNKQKVRGHEKWYVDFEKCLPFFNQHQGCAICIAVCPWSRPGVGLNLAAKLENRAKRQK